MSSEESSRIFRIRRTLIQMLKDRGYLLPSILDNQSLEEFHQHYAQNPSRDALVMLHQKRDDPTDQIFIFFPEEAKVGIKTIKGCFERMREQGANRAILVVIEKLTSHAKSFLHEVSPKLMVEEFRETELLVNITEHSLVPKHVLLSAEEKKALLLRYKLKETQLPRIHMNDPVARYYGLQKGQVVRITRPSETAGQYITYRYVM